MRKTVLAISGAMLTAFLSTLLVWFSVVGLVGAHQAQNHYPTQMLGNALLGIVVGGAVLLYAARFGGTPLRSVASSWNTRDTTYTMIMVLVTLAMAAGTMLLFNRIGRHPITVTPLRWSVVALGLVGQLGVLHEELLFRGYILTRLRRRSGGWAIVISALLFMLMHIPFKGAGFMTISWLLGGLLYGYLYLKSGSLLVTVAAHVVHNWALDLFMYSRAGVSLFQFSATRLVGTEKIAFELVLTILLAGLAYLVYGRGAPFLAQSPRLPLQASSRPDAFQPSPGPMPA